MARKTYFVSAPSVNLVKIGSSEDPPRRFTELRLISPVPLTVLAVADGDKFPERELHQAFAHLRSHGEWFYATKEIHNKIASVRVTEALDALYRYYRYCNANGITGAEVLRKNPGITLEQIRSVRIWLQELMAGLIEKEGKQRAANAVAINEAFEAGDSAA